LDFAGALDLDLNDIVVLDKSEIQQR
jgi:hypothetical protein